MKRTGGKRQSGLLGPPGVQGTGRVTAGTWCPRDVARPAFFRRATPTKTTIQLADRFHLIQQAIDGALNTVRMLRYNGPGILRVVGGTIDLFETIEDWHRDVTKHLTELRRELLK